LRAATLLVGRGSRLGITALARGADEPGAARQAEVLLEVVEGAQLGDHVRRDRLAELLRDLLDEVLVGRLDDGDRDGVLVLADVAERDRAQSVRGLGSELGDQAAIDLPRSVGVAIG